MSGKIYIVFGATGEYSDHNEWAVAAYADEALAKCHVAAATKWYQDNNCYALRHEEVFANPFDPEMDTDYTGTRWYISAAPMRTALPSDAEPMAREASP